MNNEEETMGERGGGREGEREGGGRERERGREGEREREREREVHVWILEITEIEGEFASEMILSFQNFVVWEQ